MPSFLYGENRGWGEIFHLLKCICSFSFSNQIHKLKYLFFEQWAGSLLYSHPLPIFFKSPCVRSWLSDPEQEMVTEEKASGLLPTAPFRNWDMLDQGSNKDSWKHMA